MSASGADGREESIRDMVEYEVIWLTYDSDDVILYFVREVASQDIGISRGYHMRFFTLIDSFEGIIFVRRPRLYFDKDESRAFCCDYINLEVIHPPVALDNGVTLANEMFDGDILAPKAELIMLSHRLMY